MVFYTQFDLNVLQYSLDVQHSVLLRMEILIVYWEAMGNQTQETIVPTLVLLHLVYKEVVLPEYVRMMKLGVAHNLHAEEVCMFNISTICLIIFMLHDRTDRHQAKDDKICIINCRNVEWEFLIVLVSYALLWYT